MNVIETGESVLEFGLGWPVRQAWRVFLPVSILAGESALLKLP
ncbi:hypothetical protein [Burkholderia sp. Ac-20344]|nr:hypothetical protein [Burkholderia sp. Ac-20344]